MVPLSREPLGLLDAMKSSLISMAESSHFRVSGQ